MSYSAEWHPHTKKFLQKLPKDVAIRIVQKVKAVQENPFHYLEHYSGKDYYKLRIGDYRLLIDADLSHKVLYIQVIEHRSKVYDRV
ncbi:MAG TPA: type II toxin-antitoxin system RelE/ParE family toxin [Candidatus Nanoarchaeia archaeon]|nr:type II toxin-antitoxin system RelE/ParE family toxin [Candidatus Nanoarchaeia archaeon]